MGRDGWRGGRRDRSGWWDETHGAHAARWPSVPVAPPARRAAPVWLTDAAVKAAYRITAPLTGRHGEP